MKNIFLMLLFSTSAGIYAQVGINSRNLQNAATLDIHASNKNFSMPNVSLLGKTNITTVVNPKEFDYNEEYISNPVKSYSATSPTGYTFANNSEQFLGYRAHASGESFNAKEWTEILSLRKDIEVERTENKTLMSIKGTYQANNSLVTDDGITSTIGFFVDDKLVDLKPMYLDFSSACAYKQFMIYGTASNLTPGKHTVKFAIRNISAPNTQGLTVTYGAPNPDANCETPDASEAAISSTIFIR